MTDEKSPKVTVAIPTWNRADLLKRTIESVLAQTIQDLEVYVSDDASPDHTAAVVASFHDPRLRYERLPNNIGLHANLTRCLTLGEAPYVCVLQDDDLMLPENLERKVRLLDQHPNVGLVHSAFRAIGPDDTVLQEAANWAQSDVDMIEPGELFIRRSMDHASRIDMSAAVLRRSVVEDDLFAKDDGLACDFGLWLRVASRSDIGYLAEPLTSIRIHEKAHGATEGIQDISNGHYQMTFEQIALARQVEQRFLEARRFGGLSDWRMRLASRRWARRQLLRTVVRRTMPERSTARTLTLIWQASRVEPTILFAPKTIRVLVASLVKRN